MVLITQHEGTVTQAVTSTVYFLIKHRAQQGLLFLALGLFLSCSPQQHGEGTLQARAQFQALKNELRLVTSSENSVFLKNASTTLQRTLPVSYKHIHPSILIVASGQGIAVTSPDAEILLSTTFLSAISTEAEFLFVVAHELAHTLLKHTARAQDQNQAELSAFQQQAELEADRFAVQLLIRAGYDPREASRALALAYRLRGVTPDTSSHPEFAERVFAIESVIVHSQWQPPGIRNSRRFSKFKLAATGHSL